MSRRFVYYNSSFVAGTLLLDLYPATVGYSLRKLRTAYTGYSIRVRRSSNNDELNIGFDQNGELDTSNLLDFVGSGDGFITTLYDQSGGSNNLIQNAVSEQPIIVNSGLLNTENGKPAINFGINNSLNFIDQLNGINSHLYSVFNAGDSSRFSLVGGTYVYIPFGQSGSTSTETIRIPNLINSGNSVSFYLNGQNIDSDINNRGDVFTQYVSGIGQNLIGLNNLLLQHVTRVGWGSNSVYRINGNFQELIIMNDSSNRIEIESNINSHYDIY